MIRLELFDGTKTYMFPNGDVATPERFRQDFKAIDVFPHVLEINGDVCGAVMNLNAMRQMHGIDDSLSVADALIAMQDIINTPPPAPEPTAEERIASQLEFQSLMML